MASRELTSEGRLVAGVLVAFAAVTALSAVDVVTDLARGTTARHVAVEGGVVLVGLVGAAVMARRLLRWSRDARETEARAADLATQLEATRAEVARWREEAHDVLRGLGAALDRQFARWALTPAEKEVALLLLKGLSHKEIAAVRSITEATARQQARAIYKKANLTGRADLAAFFLEDLLLPGAET